MRASLLTSIFLCSTLFAVDMPGGLMQVSDTLKKDLYEFAISPGYVMSPTGAYLSADMRVQPNQDVGAGLAFGAGQVGFHVGTHATWHVLPDVDSQPGFAIAGGLYFNQIRVESQGATPGAIATTTAPTSDYFVVKVAPMISKSVYMDWGSMTPYSAINLSPSFRLSGTAQNEFSVKGSFGMMTDIKALSGVRLWTEVDVGIWNSIHEIVFGLSYPFSAI